MAEKSKRVAICLIVDDKDNILMGKRNDTDKWTVPAGHIEKNECPFLGAARELKEETGLDAVKIELIKAGIKNGMMLYLFKIQVDTSQEINTSNDPDNECDSFSYEDPFEHVNELHVPLEENWAIEHWANN